MKRGEERKRGGTGTREKREGGGKEGRGEKKGDE